MSTRTTASRTQPSAEAAVPGDNPSSPAVLHRPTIGFRRHGDRLFGRLSPQPLRGLIHRPFHRSGAGPGRARSDRHRVVPALVIATAAAVITYGVLGSVLGGTEPTSLDVAAQSDQPPDVEAARGADHLASGVEEDVMADPKAIDPNHRTVALDRNDVLLPVEVGRRIEMVALMPTVESVEAAVVAESATVVAVDESVVVIRLTTDEARRAIKAAATGSLVLLGTD